MSNPDGRFESTQRLREHDAWSEEDPTLEPLRTTLIEDDSKSLITRNDSPDVPFSLSINPYRGCEHGCCYCFARPTHAYLGFSAGLDFETKLLYKPNAAALLDKELRNPRYRCSTIALGVNTDAYQPAERRLGITREILQVMQDFHQPVCFVTKSSLIERDLDLLVPMAARGLAQVMFSVTTLDSGLSRKLEPRAPAPRRRIEALRRLSEAGVPTGVLFAPVIPILNDSEMERVLEICSQAGAQSAGYVMLRLPHEVKDLFREWLEHHAPLKAKHVMSVVRDLRGGGKDYEAKFGERMRGKGPFADLFAKRFELAAKRLGLNIMRRELDCSQFKAPPRSGDQLSLF